MQGPNLRKLKTVFIVIHYLLLNKNIYWKRNYGLNCPKYSTTLLLILWKKLGQKWKKFGQIFFLNNLGPINRICIPIESIKHYLKSIEHYLRTAILLRNEMVQLFLDTGEYTISRSKAFYIHLFIAIFIWRRNKVKNIFKVIV